MPENEPLWCDECLARRPWKHDRVTYCWSYRFAHWIASVFNRISEWFGRRGDSAQMRANRRAGLDIGKGRPW